jgi:RNA polymerase sigma-70 factor, ECF subfamily
MSDPQLFEALVLNYQNMVFSTAMRLVANQAEAEDISQEVFLRAYSHWEEIAGSPTIGGWLRTVATNLSLNHLSRYRSRWTFFSELFTGGGEDDEREVEFQASTDVEAEVNRTDHRELVEQALQSLPPTQRVPLVLYHMDNLQYDEIAARLGCSLGKVKTDIHRGREALRRKLEKTLRAEAA